ncbi:MAG: cysteine desulfurase, partial [Nitrospirales bacterium]|nr:cysteine desulfurase [Nitrospirales bacterium]
MKPERYTMGNDPIYLDHNATTPLDDAVRKAVVESLPLFGNPSSSHRFGAAAKAAIEKARGQVARLISAGPQEIVFTSGGTESNNLAILGTAFRRQGGHLITSVSEHPSVSNPVRWLEGRGYDVSWLPVDADGRVSPDAVRKAVRKDTLLITLMHSNNETGVLQPIAEVGDIAREYGIPFHSDAAQSVGKVEVNAPGLKVDMLTVVSHKFYGPKGVGALYLRGGGEEGCSPESAGKWPAPLLFGAGHERGLRPGTENTTGIVGLGAACEGARHHLPERFEHSLALRETLFSLLCSELDIRLNGHAELRLPNTLNLSVRGSIGEDLVAALGDVLAFSAGSACHAGVRKPSAVLKAMGIPDR